MNFTTRSYGCTYVKTVKHLTVLHSERPKLYGEIHRMTQTLWKVVVHSYLFIRHTPSFEYYMLIYRSKRIEETNTWKEEHIPGRNRSGRPESCCINSSNNNNQWLISCLSFSVIYLYWQSVCSVISCYNIPIISNSNQLTYSNNYLPSTVLFFIYLTWLGAVTLIIYHYKQGTATLIIYHYKLGTATLIINHYKYLAWQGAVTSDKVIYIPVQV